MMDIPVVTNQRRGAIGVHINAEHLAVAETDASGNCLNAWRVPLVTYGKSQHQPVQAVVRPAGWPGRGPARRSRVRFTGGAAWHCWGGGNRVFRNGWRSFVTKVNHFFNGRSRPASECRCCR